MAGWRARLAGAIRTWESALDCDIPCLSRPHGRPDSRYASQRATHREVDLSLHLRSNGRNTELELVITGAAMARRKPAEASKSRP
jgi:hypothetical protein